jgi:hypothetical protein
MGRTARLAAMYPYQLCAAIIKGFSKQLTKDGVMEAGCIGLHMREEVNDMSALLMSYDIGDNSIGGCSTIRRPEKDLLSLGKPYSDDLTGTPLDRELVEAAIVKELKYVEET